MLNFFTFANESFLPSAGMKTVYSSALRVNSLSSVELNESQATNQSENLLKKFILRTLGIVALLLFFGGSTWGQVNAYTFDQTTGTYADITGGTLLGTATANASGSTGMDDNIYNVSIPFTFTFNGAGYTSLNISTNGFITFGATAPAGNNWAPISSTGAYAGAISAWGRDLSGMFNLGGKTSTLRWETVGTAPNREVVIQFKDFRIAWSTSTSTAPYFNFQIRLKETSNIIDVIFGPSGMAAGTSNTNTTAQVGLRGANNTFTPNVLNRTNATTVSVNSSTAGTTNASTQAYSSVTATPGWHANGKIYRWTPPAPPACAAPSALTSSSITSTSATISWTAASPAPTSGYEYFYFTSSTAPTAGTTPSGTTAAGVVTANITGLTANTTYYYWVRSNCGGSGTSTWAGSSTFFTGYCTPTGTSSTYYISNVTTTGGQTNIANATVSNAGYGNFTAQSASNSIGTGTSFTVAWSASNNGCGVWINWNNDLDFADANEQIAITTGYIYSPFTGTINIPAGTPVGSYRMRIVMDYNTYLPISCPVAITGETEDYTFTVAAPPSCPGPTALVGTPISLTSATISWSAASPAPASGYEYFYSTIATAPTAGTTPSGSTAAGVVTANITGLTANTTYYYWVRSNCGGSGTSTWAGASTFFTGYCTPTGTSSTYYISNVTTTGGQTNIANATASNAGYGNFTVQSASNSIGTGTSFSVAHSASGIFDGAGVGVWINWNNDLDFADANEQIGITTGWNYSPYTGTINIPAGTPVGSYRMRIVIDYNSVSPISCPVAITGETEDYTFTVAAPPSCPGPTALVGTPISLTSATISWSAASPAPASGYEYFYSTVATAPTAGTTPSGSTAAGVTTANLSSLTSGSTYYFWVRSVCSVSDLSSWAGAGSFYVGYCQPVTTYGCTDGDVIARVVLNTLDNNSGTGCPSDPFPLAFGAPYGPGYSDYTTDPLLTTTLLPSSTYSCTVFAGQYGEGYAAWIDYNDDGVFDNVTERIGYSNGQVAGSGVVGVLGSSASFPITLACTPPAGNHRLRVRAMYSTNGINVTPCTSNSYGEIEDYTITIAAAPACPSPGLVSTITPTSNSVALTWATNCSAATSYDFEYGPVGFTLGSGTLVSNQPVTISAPNASYTVTGLQAGTNYDIYYRANCGSSTSAWSLSTNFTTLNAVSAASSTPTLCQGTAMTSITHNTQGATGIGAATGLPSGITAAWSSNVITISGTPAASGVFSYSIPLTGGLGSVNATGTITVLAAPSAPTAASPQVFCETANATIASLQVSGAVGSSFAWYSGATGGVAFSNSVALSIGTVNYFVEQIGSNGCSSLTRTSVVVTELPLLSASVSITGTTACPGGVLLFTSTPVNGGVNPTYQWYKNGAFIPNEMASTYSASGLLPGDIINVKMVPSGSCVTVCP